MKRMSQTEFFDALERIYAEHQRRAWAAEDKCELTKKASAERHERERVNLRERYNSQENKL